MFLLSNPLHPSVPYAVLFAVALGLLTSCIPNQWSKPTRGDLLKASESCYSPKAVRLTPPPPKEQLPNEVPILDTLPPGSRILGELKLSADFGLVMDALQYNARRTGADAIVIQKLTWWDILHWSEPTTRTNTKVTPPTEDEKKEYKQKLQEYEKAKTQGKKVTKPSVPTASKSYEEASVPGRWNNTGGASVDAVLIEWNPPLKKGGRTFLQSQPR